MTPIEICVTMLACHVWAVIYITRRQIKQRAHHKHQRNMATAMRAIVDSGLVDDQN